MIEQGLLVFEQPVVTAIQLVDFGQPEVFAEQIGHGTALKPFAMQPPFAARRQQPVGRQQQQHPVPPRALAARRQPSAPETIELKLAPQAQRQPASAPLARPGTTAARLAATERSRRPAAIPRNGPPETATACAAAVPLPPGWRLTCAKPVPANR